MSILDERLSNATSFNQTKYAPPTNPFKQVSLELSLKPFYDNSSETREAVCHDLFRKWMPLCKDADVVSVMLWIGDGSEMIEFNGKMDDTFDWGKYLGCISSSVLKEEEEVEEEEEDLGLGLHGADADPDNIGLHRRTYLYRDDPAEFTYSWLKELISDLKRIGTKLTGKPVVVGDTYDPGPELGPSRFKYERHPEILGAIEFMGGHFVYCGTTLAADPQPYAAFPDGIPEGTHLGTFMGKQAELFFKAVGFDFLWFSNGFGFGSETLTLTGKLFDGETFDTARTAEYEETVWEFWKKFREAAPEIPLRMRGSNMTTGIDLASDAVPLDRIYKETENFEPPVNCPWAAMDGDFGLEFAGWMSHIAELPNETFPFRFYTSDPWWMNSPWLDRYERSPHDIYMPLSICRLKEDGSAHTPETIAFLTCDNSIGQIPDQIAADVSSHITRARENLPDQAGPIVWVYPWKEYHQMTFSDDPKLKEVYFGDWYARGIINQSLPLNTVVSTRNFVSATDSSDRWLGNILFVSTCSDPAVHEKVLAHVAAGGRAIYYGPLTENAEQLTKLLGVEAASEIEGDFEIKWSDSMVELVDPAKPTTIHHPATFSGGGLSHLGVETENVEEIATAVRDNEARSLARLVQRPEWNGGMLAWLRGGVTCDETRAKQFLPIMLNEKKVFHVEEIAGLIVERMGLHHGMVAMESGTHKDLNKGLYHSHAVVEAGDRKPLLTISRSRNAYVFSGYNPSDLDVSLSLPLGAPLLTSRHATVRDGKAIYHTPTGWQSECRILVDGQADGRLSVKEWPVIMAGVQHRVQVSGLKNAKVRFFPEAGEEDTLEFLRDPSAPFIVGDFIKPVRVESPEGIYYETEELSGSLMISW